MLGSDAYSRFPLLPCRNVSKEAAHENRVEPAKGDPASRPGPQVVSFSRCIRCPVPATRLRQ